MDHELLKQLAKFKMLLRRSANHSVDIEKLLADRAYAKQVLSIAEEADSEELVVMALELKDKLGLLSQPAAPAAKANDKPEDDEKPKDKYVFGPRG